MECMLLGLLIKSCLTNQRNSPGTEKATTLTKTTSAYWGGSARARVPLVGQPTPGDVAEGALFI